MAGADGMGACADADVDGMVSTLVVPVRNNHSKISLSLQPFSARILGVMQDVPRLCDLGKALCHSDGRVSCL
jgi:hypothetical protein